MTKAELISQMAQDAGIPKTAAASALQGFIDAVTQSLKDGDGLTLVGFGSFSVSERPARDGRNPQTGEKLKIPASVVAKFKPGKVLKGVLNNR